MMGFLGIDTTTQQADLTNDFTNKLRNVQY